MSCVNALSQEFNVEIGATALPGRWISAAVCPPWDLRKSGTSKKRGTKVHFLPDKSIFAVTEYNYDTLAQRLRELAFLNKGLEITLTDERTTDPKTGESKRTEFRYAGGIAEFVKHLNRGKQVLHDKPIVMEAAKRDGVEMEDRPPVQRRLLGVGVQFCQQHQHRRRRLAPLGFPHLAHPHHQCHRAVAGALQGYEGKPGAATTCARAWWRWCASSCPSPSSRARPRAS